MIDLLILYVLLKNDLTMYSIHKRILAYFRAYTSPSFGALKPALVRLEKNKFISSEKMMSDGGKLSIFYSITKDGMKELKNLLLKPFSNNPLQFLSDSRVKLSCASYLNREEIQELLYEIKTNAYVHKASAGQILGDEYNPTDFYQRIALDNTICEYNNLISMIEGLEKENAGNSK